MNNSRIHFIANPATGDDLDVLRTLAWEEGTVACTRHTWVWALYCQLKLRGIGVSISYEFETEAINVVHCQTARGLLKASDFRKYFIVGIRADFRPFPYGQFEIVQNRHSESARCIYIPLYPQPGLLERDPRRGEVVNVCFSGRPQNSIDYTKLKDDLKKIGCRFVFKGVGRWHEMFDVDILLGIRSLSKRPYHSKPATKLFNAWLAGIPFIGGYDSAFSQVGVPGENYIRVSSYEELINSIRDLVKNPALYKKLQQNGKVAGAGYTSERITDLWVELLEGKIFPAYQQWCLSSSRWHLKSFFLSRWFFVREKLIANLLLLLKIR